MKNSQKNSKKTVNGFSSVFKSDPVTVIFAAVSTAFCIVTVFFDYRIALIELCVVAAATVVAMIIRDTEFRRMRGAVSAIDQKFSAEDGGGLQSFPMPIVIFNSLEKIIWYNNLFRQSFIKEKPRSGGDIKQFTSGQGLSVIRERQFINCEFGGKRFTAYCSSTEYKNETAYALYFVEDTELKQYKDKYENSRPVVMLISLDGADDVLREFRESRQAEISGGIETIIENWFARFDCLVKKLGSGRFIVVAESDSVEKMKEDKFSILSLVRSYTYSGKVLGLTLSIGAGSGSDLSKCESSARTALDMALGRGGDQVAIKTGKNEYEFFGGVAKGVEKRTKVRTRRVASAVEEIIKSSSNVLIMGHRFADLDALGSAAGIAMICRALEKDVKIVMSSKTTLAMPLAKYLMENGLDDLLIEPADADEYIESRTALVIVDTHRKSFLESPELFDLIGTVVVIDHHRKTVDHISKAVIFYHEPNASSASEMVTELIQYTSCDVPVPKVCAEALLSGITLDTKNFVLKTGVRTFEAAAFLRSLGADTVAVKQLFSNSMNTQRDKSEVVKNAAMYKNCAIGAVDFASDDARIVAAQAADELLNIDGVCASFVMFSEDSTVNISARSYGEINVQLIMEQLGGGGHQTMAAAQLTDETFDGALLRLRNEIDKIN